LLNLSLKGGREIGKNICPEGLSKNSQIAPTLLSLSLKEVFDGILNMSFVIAM